MPTIDDVRYDPRARAEARQTVRNLAEEHLVEMMNAQKKESRQSTQRLRSQWEEDWRLYQSDVDWSDKEEWQSKVWIPMPFSAVEQATGIIRRSMLDSAEFFGIEGQNQYEKRLASRLWKPLLKLAFDKTGFVPKFANATKVAFATGISLYLKFRWSSFRVPTLRGAQMDPATGELVPIYDQQNRSFLTIDTVPPWQVFRDPDSKPGEQWSGTFIMHEEYVGRPFLSNGKTAGAFRNTERVSEGVKAAGGSDDGPEAQARRKQQTWERNKFRKTYLATEWYGDIVDHNGEAVYPDGKMIMANDILVHGPVDNPLWAVDHNSGRRKWPLIGFSPISHPLRFEGYGILRAVTPLAMMFSNLFNLFGDGLNWAVNKPTEVDMSVLEDWDDLEHIPGRLWFKSGPGAALSPANIGTMESNTVLAALQFVHQQFENESFVTSFLAGLPGSRTNITMGETRIKTQQSMGIFDAMAREMEGGGKACVGLAFDFLHQFLHDYSDPSLVEIVGRENANLIALMAIDERMRTMGGNFEYMFTGISAAIQKAEMLGRLMQAAQLAAQPYYAGRTNPSEMLTAIIDTLGVDDKIEIADQPMVPLAAAQQMVQQALAAGTGGAGGGGTMPGAASAGVVGALPPHRQSPTLHQLEPTANEIASGAGG